MGENFKFFFKFLEGIRLHWRDYIFKVLLRNQVKFLFLVILKGFSECLPLFKLIFCS